MRLLLALLTLLITSSTLRAAERPLVLVHYMPWFEADPDTGTLGWHWTMNVFEPPTLASHYQPLIGAYDSGDPRVIEFHLRLMKEAGIDGVILDWYGRAEHFDYAQIHRNSKAIIDAAEALGLQVAICYEDRTAVVLEEAGKVEGRVEAVREELDWLEIHWFTRKNYVQIEGKPMLLSFGFEGLNVAQWREVLADRSVAYFSEHHRRTAALGAFDWPVPQVGLAAQAQFAARDNGLSIPVVFPRFHDIYEQAGLHQSYGEIPDNEGKTFADLLDAALHSGAPVVQIATWNDWGEGTVIEPSVTFGFRDLRFLRRALRPDIPDNDEAFDAILNLYRRPTTP